MMVDEFLKYLIGPEFVYVHVLDPAEYRELTQGFADDLIDNVMYTGRLKVLSFYFRNNDLIINVKVWKNE